MVESEAEQHSAYESRSEEKFKIGDLQHHPQEREQHDPRD